MTDFTLSAPGTTNSPWTPSNIIVPVSTIKSDATGFRATSAGTFADFAHNVSYGSTITSTATIASGGTSNGDEIWLGAIVRSGPNAGAGIGVLIAAFSVATATWTGLTGTGGSTKISADVSITRANSDVWTATVTISAGTATITCKQGATTITFSANTTTNFTSESSLAAGCCFNPQNNNSLYLSQFTGTGVASGVNYGVITATERRRRRV